MATNSSGISTKEMPKMNQASSFANMEGAPSATNNGNQGLGSTADGMTNSYGPGGPFSGYSPNPNPPQPMPSDNGQSSNPYGLPDYSPTGQTQSSNLFPQQGSMGFGGYSSMTGGGGQNPFIQDQANAIKTQFNQNLSEQTLPALRDKFIGSGGLGGSRQGIAEGLAAGRSNQGLAGALASLYGNSWESDQNRNVQRAGLNMQGTNAQMADQLARLNSERNFYSTNRGQDIQQMGLAAGLLVQADQGFRGQGEGLYNTGLMEQQAPQQQLSWLNSMYAPYTQAGATNTGTNTQQYTYNPWMQALGGAAQGAQGMFSGGANSAASGMAGFFGGGGSAAAAGSTAFAPEFAAMAFSDVRLKENIRPVGETYDGLGVYTYNYKGDDKPQMGVMAQEVERKRPDALGPTIGGFKTVRYGLLG